MKDKSWTISLAFPSPVSHLRHGGKGFADLRGEAGEGVGEFVADEVLHVLHVLRLRRRDARRPEEPVRRRTTTGEICG